MKQETTPSVMELNLFDPFEMQVARIVKTHRERNPQYFTSPLSILPVEDWLTQTAIKGVRAQQATFKDKVVDELVDTAVYAIMTLEQIAGQNWDRVHVVSE